MADPTFGPRGWTPQRLGPQKSKTFLITGGNAGAGFEAARILLGKGARVVMLNRSTERSEAAVAKLKEEFGAGAEVSFVRMDLSVLDSVRDAAAEVLEIVPRIDALICNAAIAQVPTQKLTVDGFESMLGTNHYGHFLLSGLLFERIEESKGRIVVIVHPSAVAHHRPSATGSTASMTTCSHRRLTSGHNAKAEALRARCRATRGSAHCGALGRCRSTSGCGDAVALRPYPTPCAGAVVEQRLEARWPTTLKQELLERSGLRAALVVVETTTGA